MNNSDDILAKKIIAELNAGLDDVRPEILERLHLARERACAHAQHKSEAHVGAGHSMALVDKLRQHRMGILGAVLMMLLLASFVVMQSNMDDDDDTASVDTALLTGDLPVNAYLDGHISKWVNNDSE
ncbi:DUF3619 family protein [Sulfuriferula nivalis]|uniref:DUF3619 family protein n=1 Tax=Sulfuriferula nivalis TaxID=2675298 RepID=A0A809S179_9PROT|nr:DUF3619 family protein [Sulfuriferula nivalis]BBP00298.1 hypothetical protein SFSGTM_10060 [Sulfuriferula nivalis]